MEAREFLNTAEGFAEIINLKQGFIEKRLAKIESIKEDEKNGISNYPKSNAEVIKSTRDTIALYYLDLIFAMYSAGYKIGDIKKEYEKLLDIMFGNWKAKTSQDFTYQDSEPFYGTDEYWQVLQVVSLGVLLQLDGEDGEKVVFIRDKVPTADILLDFLTSYFDKRKYGDEQSIGDKYNGLAKVIKESTTDNASSIMKAYLNKEWFKDYKRQGILPTHNSKFNIHNGYWSFESGAIMKIMGADDSILKDQQFYPYDMVHWQ